MKASFAHREGRLAEAEKGYREVLRKKPDWGQVLNSLENSGDTILFKIKNLECRMEK